MVFGASSACSLAHKKAEENRRPNGSQLGLTCYTLYTYTLDGTWLRPRGEHAENMRPIISRRRELPSIIAAETTDFPPFIVPFSVPYKRE